MFAVILPLLTVGQATQCEKPDGTKAPCGPGNDLCHSPGCKPPHTRPRELLFLCIPATSSGASCPGSGYPERSVL